MVQSVCNFYITPVDTSPQQFLSIVFRPNIFPFPIFKTGCCKDVVIFCRTTCSFCLDLVSTVAPSHLLTRQPNSFNHTRALVRLNQTNKGGNVALWLLQQLRFNEICPMTPIRTSQFYCLLLQGSARHIFEALTLHSSRFPTHTNCYFSSPFFFLIPCRNLKSSVCIRRCRYKY
ncbi:hypothetical protein ASPSYDRAFT_518690 [Aspergillus sydowii CBS 593.65]|uniref:Uncharacterized protein n=1 Tax=Aspergillus sydowii CBS 593.65 TaxID=1036612 RepID=A0A1L9T3F5_9EURO|nr:uncharacterized protein ASPSYDRAFT_518690 [Aspergillus sydowii CBS 593.65]OJJ53984.1 hypothetical protein ASPSYDRAFT_518690 [Aspergillus sydowii CBS 593.65]